MLLLNITMDSGIRKFYKNLRFVSLGAFASKCITYLLIPLYTSALTTAEYGVSDLIFTTSMLIMPLFTLVISESVLRFCFDKSSDDKQVFSAGLAITVAGTALFLALSPLILLVPLLKDYYFLFLLYFITLIFSDLVSYFTRGKNRIKEFAFSGVVNTIVLLALNLYFLLVLKIGVKGYLLSYIIARVMVSVYLIISVKIWKHTIKLKDLDWHQIKSMLKYSVPLIPNTINWWIISSSDRYLVTIYCGMAVNGLYAVASKIPSLLTALNSIFNTAWQISAFEDFGSDESNKKYSAVCYSYYSFLFIASSVIILATKLLAKMLFQTDFYQAWIFSPILVYASMSHAFASFYGTVFTATKKTKHLMVSTVLGALFNIVLNFCLIPEYGGIGAAVATAISYLIVYVYRLCIARRLFKFNQRLINDLICNIFLVAELILVVCDISITYSASALLFVAILFMRRHFVVDSVSSLYKALCRKKRQ